MAYTREQRKVIREIQREARRRYGRGGYSKPERRKIRSAFQTGRIESNFTNPTQAESDRDSSGWRQERAMYYSNPMNIRAATKRYFNEADQAYHGQAPAALAQATQQSAFPERYRTARSEAIKLTKKTVKGKAVRGGKGGKSTPTRITSKTRTIPGVDNSALRKSLMLQYLQESGKPSALIDLATGLRSARDVPARTETDWRVKPGKPNSRQVPTGKKGAERVRKIFERAAHMDSRKMPYLWGGGHSSGTITGPWDCSGAVSRVLRINPLVSGQFMSWGKPGKGKRVTIYANNTHVLMSINGRFWGTSRSNPRGGAGWIAKPSDSYLSQFTARHPEGL